MEVARLMTRALENIDILELYYVEQYSSMVKRVKKELVKYKYGMAIFKFLCSRVHCKEKPDCITEIEENFLREEIDVLDDEFDEKNVKYRLKNPEKYIKYELDPVIARKKSLELIEQPRLLNDSAIVMLLIQYENTISELFESLLRAFPDAYLKEKSISYSDLMALNSNLSDVLDNLIENEAAEFMRKPISDWYKTFEQKHKLHFEFDDQFDCFKEIYYRRNVIVHNQGRANKIYKWGDGGI